MDDDSVGEGLIVGLDVKGPLLSVQCVFLDEVHVVHTSNLQIHTHTHTQNTDTHARKHAQTLVTQLK